MTQIVLSFRMNSIPNQRNDCSVSEKPPLAFSPYASQCKVETSALLEQVTGENGESSMRRREDFEDAPKGKVTILDDFLPPPSQLVRKEETVKITLEFTRSSIDFLKEEAKKAHVPYQRMLRALVDKYVEQHIQKS